MILPVFVERAFVFLMLALPRPLRRLIAGPPRVSDGQELDLNAQLLARVDQLMGGSMGSDHADPAEARRAMRTGSLSVAGRRRVIAQINHDLVAGAAGVLNARVYRSLLRRPGDAAPLMLYFHGGGWVVGDLDTHDAPCRALADAIGGVVISVDYRLAPEHPFPACVDDAVAAYMDVRGRAADFGIDPDQIVVAGDSAGGHLAASLCQRVRDTGGELPAAQVLIYPATDFTHTYQSERDFAEGLLLSKADMDWFTGHFLRSDSDREAASPLRAESLSGLPPALVITAGFDPLRDEGEAYAAALIEAGVDVAHRRYGDQLHGFINMLGVTPAAQQAIGEIAGVLRAWGVRKSATLSVR